MVAVVVLVRVITSSWFFGLHLRREGGWRKEEGEGKEEAGGKREGGGRRENPFGTVWHCKFKLIFFVRSASRR